MASISGGSPTALERKIVSSALGRVLQQADARILGPVAHRRNFVGRRRMGFEFALIVPVQLFG